MRKHAALALVLLASSSLAVAANGTRRDAHRMPSSSVAAIAAASTSWAEFSSTVPNVELRLSEEARRAGE